MKKPVNFLNSVVVLALFSGCAATIPQELVDARKANAHASHSPAAKEAPAELHVANDALAKAEQAYKDDADSYIIRDLAYVAHRKALFSEATAAIVLDKRSQSRSNEAYQETQSQIVDQTRKDLSATEDKLADSEGKLADSEHSERLTAEQLAAAKVAQADAEKRAAAAQAALAKLADVKNEPRGMVLTLSGSVLFASNQATILPAARARLDQVAEVLLTTRERDIVVEGHTDSRGVDEANVGLSQRRADAVRDYLVSRGYESDKVQARGLGEGTPVADNTSPEGRANNRRVEIVIKPDSRQ
ncbi:MAG: hypothetical protein RJA70_3776 [Pseudomonadota bacterium]|jgi:outer membrane protein OmpA-like peptidoglycan-associated protein